MRTILLPFVACLFYTHCSKKVDPLPAKIDLPPKLMQDTYRYAFSGKILNAETKTPIEKFSIECLNVDPTINVVLNSLGNEEGIFHTVSYTHLTLPTTPYV